MLKTIEISSLADKKKILQKFDPKNSLWISADIKSRSFILENLKVKKAQENCVLRAQDFWRLLLEKTRPQWHIESQKALSLIYKEWAKNKKKEWQRQVETGVIISEIINTISHLLKHPQRDSLMQEWLNTRTGGPWQKWYRIAQEFYDYLRANNIIEQNWVDTHLLDTNLSDFLPWKMVIFDLGFNINPIEVQLIQQISQTKETVVLTPIKKNKQEWGLAHPMYNVFHKKITGPKTAPRPPDIKVKKFAVELAEVKDITAEVKQKLKNHPAERIAVIAPNIENYWSCLKSHFTIENIPFQKTETARVVSFPSVQLWLAYMNIHLENIQPEYLETVFYDSQSQNKDKKLNYSQKTSYPSILSFKDLPKIPPIKQALRKDPEQTVSIKDFIDWAKKFQPNLKSPALTRKMKEILSDMTKSMNIHLPFSSWLQLLTSYFKETEIPLTEEQPNGVKCLSFNALEWLSADFIYIAGLSEQNLKNQKPHFISSMEADLLNEDLGFFSKIEPIDNLEQSISYFIQKEYRKIVMSFSTTSFLGEPLNPSAIWLKKAVEQNSSSMNRPGPHRWGQISQKTKIKDILALRKFTPEQLNTIETSLNQDAGKKNLQPFFTKNSKDFIKKLSASSLKDYAKCPFIFAAKNLFKLSDEPLKDVDISYKDKGNIMHELFHELKKENTQNINTKEIIKKIIDKRIKNTYPTILENEKSYLLKKAYDFLENEKRLKTIFKDLEFQNGELKFTGYWSLTKAEPDKKEGLLITGSIDRVDKDKEGFFLIDYKRKLPVGAGIQGWEKQNNFQMALYIKAVEKGLTELPPESVHHALYVSYTENFKPAGFALKTEPSQELLNSKRNSSLVEKEKKEELINQLNRKINDLILKMQAGEFSPQPFKETLCHDCQWRKLCRAPHLN